MKDIMSKTVRTTNIVKIGSVNISHLSKLKINKDGGDIPKLDTFISFIKLWQLIEQEMLNVVVKEDAVVEIY